MEWVNRAKNFLWGSLSTAEPPLPLCDSDQKNRAIADELPCSIYRPDDYSSKDEFFEKTARKMGVLWKYIQEGSNQEKYIRVKSGWSGKKFEKISFSDLAAHDRKLRYAYVTAEEIQSEKNESSSSLAQRGALFAVGALVAAVFGRSSSPYELTLFPGWGEWSSPFLHGGVAYTFSMQSGHRGYAAPHAFTTVFLSLSSAVKSETNQAPYNSDPIPDLFLEEGETFTLYDIQEKFTDPNGDLLDIQFPTLPPFISEIRANFTLIKEFPDGPSYNFLKVHNWVYSPYTSLLIWNLTDSFDLIPFPPYTEVFCTVGLHKEELGFFAEGFSFLFHVINLTIPYEPEWIASLPLDNECCSSAVQMIPDTGRNEIIWLAKRFQDRSLIHAVDISDPTSPRIAGSINATFSMYSMTMAENGLLFISNIQGPWAFKVMNTTDLGNMTDVGYFYDASLSVSSMAVKDSILYIHDNPDFRVYDVSDPGTPQLLTSMNRVTRFHGFQGGIPFINYRQSTGSIDTLVGLSIENTSSIHPVVEIPLGYNGGPWNIIIEQNRLFYNNLQFDPFALVALKPIHLSLRPGQNDRGEYPITVWAKDYRGGETSYTFNVFIQGKDSSSTPAATTFLLPFTTIGTEEESRQSEQSYLGFAIAAGIIGGGCLLGGGVGAWFLIQWYKKKSKAARTVEHESFELHYGSQ